MADTIITVGGDLTQLERQIQDVLSRNFRLSGLDSRGFTQPLGKIKGQLGEFEKSLEASNARVVAFGASAGAIYLLGDAFKGLVRSTIEVEKSLADINTVLGESSSNIKKFGNEIFNVANDTSQSFETAAQAALEFSRQGLGLEETLKRTSAALTLAKISGLSAADSVEALTATINSFNDAALTDIQIVNKLAAVDARYAVSSADLAEAIKRVGSSASEAGVSLDQLIALVTSAQQTTARGGAVIGNSFKTIFTRIQRPKVLESLEEIGITTKSVTGQTLPLIQILNQLASTYDSLSSAQKSQVAELVGGVYQINILKAVIGDLSKEFGSTYAGALRASSTATNEAEKRIGSLAQTLDSQINRITNNLKRAGSVIGDLTIAPALEKVLGAANNILETFALGKEPESYGEKAAVGFLKGLGNFISGPGLILGAAAAFQIFKRLAAFVNDAGKTILGLGQASQRQAEIQAQILQLLQRNPALYSQIQSGAISVQDAAQGYLNIVNLTNAALERQKALAGQIAQVAFSGGTGPITGATRGPRRRASSGFIPNFAAEGQILESVGAANHKTGYKAGKAYQTTIHDGKGKSFRSWVNSAEKVKTFTNAAGYKATIVRPPNGFGPGTQMAAEGFIPNFAPKKVKDKDKGLRIFRSDAKVSSISGSKLNASFDRKESSYRINISPTSTAFFESSDKRKQMDTGRKSLDAGYTVENGQIVPNSAFDKFMGAINVYKVADAEEITTAANAAWEGLIKKDANWTTNPVFSKLGLSQKNARRAFFDSLRKNKISYSDIKEKFNRQSGNATNDVVFKFGSGKTMTSPKDYEKSLNGDFNNFKGAFYESYIANKLGSKYSLSKGDYDPVDIMAKEGAGTKFKGFEIKSGSVANVSTLVNKAINSVNFNSANDAPAVVDFGTFPVIQTRGSSIGGVSNFSSGFIPNFAPGDGSYTLAEYANKKGVRISQLKKSAFNAAYEKGVSLSEIKQYDPKFEYKGATIQEAARRAEAAQAQKQKLKEDFGFNKKLIKEIVIPWNKTAADFGGNNAAFGDAYESHVFQFLRQRYGDRFKTATELGLVGTRTKDGQIVDRNFADVEGALLDKKGRIMMWFDAKAQSQKGQLAYSRTGKGGVADKFFRAEAKNPNLKLNPRRVAAVFRNMSKGFVPHFAPVRGGTFYDFDETLVHYPKDINPKELFFPESVRKASLTPLGRSLQKSSSPINVLTARGKNSKSAIEQFLTKSNIPFNKVIASAEMFRNIKVPGVRKNERGLTSAEKKARFLQNLYGKTRMPSRLIDDAPANIQAIQGLNNPNITGELYSTEGQMGLGRSFKSSGFIPNFAKSKNFAEYRNNAIQKIETKNEYGYIESFYPKNTKIGNKKLEGSVLASPLGPNLYSIGASGVNIVGGGFGVPLYDSVLAEVSKKEAWLTSDRAIVSEKAKKIWDGYRKLRTGDVKNKKLPMKYWIADIAFTGGDNNLSGNPVNAMLKNKSNWPPENDPVWALQYAYQFKKSKLDNLVKKKMSSGFIPNFAELDSGARSMLIGSGIIPFVVDLQRKTMAASSAGDDMFHSQIVNKKFIDPKTGKSIYTKLYGDDIHSATWKDTFVRGFVNSSTGAVTFDLTAPQKEDKQFLSKHSVLLEKVKQKYAEKFKSAIQIKPKRISPLAAFRSSGFIPNFASVFNPVKHIKQGGFIGRANKPTVSGLQKVLNEAGISINEKDVTRDNLKNLLSSKENKLKIYKLLKKFPVLVGQYPELYNEIKDGNHRFELAQIAGIKNIPSTFSSKGFIPNFNAALNDAVNREMDAGYSKSQIRIGKSASLATGLNPEGYGVYNSTEGSLQRGMSFAQKAGIDPKTKGMSVGHVPNFATVNAGNVFGATGGFGSLTGQEQSKFIELNKALSKLAKDTTLTAQDQNNLRNKIQLLAKSLDGTTGSTNIISETNNALNQSLQQNQVAQQRQAATVASNQRRQQQGVYTPQALAAQRNTRRVNLSNSSMSGGMTPQPQNVRGNSSEGGLMRGFLVNQLLSTGAQFAPEEYQQGIQKIGAAYANFETIKSLSSTLGSGLDDFANRRSTLPTGFKTKGIRGALGRGVTGAARFGARALGAVGAAAGPLMAAYTVGGLGQEAIDYFGFGGTGTRDQNREVKNLEEEQKKYKTESGKALAGYLAKSRSTSGAFGEATGEKVQQGFGGILGSMGFGTSENLMKFDFGGERKQAAAAITEQLGGSSNLKKIYEESGGGQGKGSLDKFTEKVFATLQNAGKETGGLTFDKERFKLLQQQAAAGKALNEEETKLLETYKAAKDAAGQLQKNLQQMEKAKEISKTFQGVASSMASAGAKATAMLQIYKLVQEKEKQRGELLKTNYGGGYEGFMNPQKNLDSMSQIENALKTLNDPRLKGNAVERGRAAARYMEGTTALGINMPVAQQAQLSKMIEMGQTTSNERTLNTIGMIGGRYGNNFGIQQGIAQSRFAEAAVTKETGLTTAERQLSAQSAMSNVGYRTSQEMKAMTMTDPQVKALEATVKAVEESMNKLAGLAEAAAANKISTEQFNQAAAALQAVANNKNPQANIGEQLQAVFNTLPEKLQAIAATNTSKIQSETSVTGNVKLDLTDEAKKILATAQTLINLSGGKNSQDTDLPAGTAMDTRRFNNCHIARLCIPDEWQAFYFWKELIAPDWFRNFYNKYSESIANWMNNKPTVQKLVAKWMKSRINKLIPKNK